MGSELIGIKLLPSVPAGAVTVQAVLKAVSAKEWYAGIGKWAQPVQHSWAEHYEWVKGKAAPYI